VSSSASDSDEEDFFATGSKPKASSASSGPSAAAASKYGGPDSDDSDDDWGEGEARVVLSAEERRIKELNELLESITEAGTEFSFKQASTEFAKLQKAYEKHRVQMGVPSSAPYEPAFYRVISSLNSSLDASKGKKLIKLESKAANGLRSTIKKMLASSPAMATALAKFEEDGDDFAEFGGGAASDDEEEVEEEQEVKAPAAADDGFTTVASGKSKGAKGKKAAKNKKKVEEEEEDDDEDDGFTTVTSAKKGGAATKAASKASKDDDDDDDDEGGSGSDDDSFWSDDESDDDESDDDDFEKAKSSRKAKWMQSSDDEDDRVAKKTKAKRDRSDKGKAEKKVSKKKGGADAGEGSATVEWTPARVTAGAEDLLAKRGTRGNEPRKQATRWRVLVKHAEKLEMSVPERASLHLQLILTLLDSTPSLVLPLSVGLFATVAEAVSELLNLLESMKSKAPTRSTVVKGVFVEGGVASVVARLDGEWTKALRKADPSKSVYVERLRQEQMLMGLLSRTQALLERLSAKGVSASLALRLLEHLYYRRASPSVEVEGTWLTPEQHVAKVQSLVAAVAADGEAAGQVKALLCLVYTEALHGDFAAAKERLAVSKVADAVGGLDVPTQALFNRCLAMLGISAFRAGLFSETYSSLVDLLSSNKLRELLAQGVSIGRQASLAERALAERERERQLPFHMHLNLDMVEAVFLVSAMLVEIPASSRHHTSSRAWRRLLDLAEKQAFAGSPESTRECVLAAARHLASGDWVTAEENVLRIDALDLVPPPSDKWKETLRCELQRAGLIAYVRAYSLVYRSVSLDSLAARFSLPTTEVYTTLSKLIMNCDLAASWADDVLLFLAERPSKLHSVAMTVADRIAALVDVNEREFDALVSA